MPELCNDLKPRYDCFADRAVECKMELAKDANQVKQIIADTCTEGTILNKLVKKEKKCFQDAFMDQKCSDPIVAVLNGASNFKEIVLKNKEACNVIFSNFATIMDVLSFALAFLSWWLYGDKLLQKEEFTHFWIIENYPYCRLKKCEPISSPVFSIGETAWHFRIDSTLESDGNYYFSLYLVREMNDNGPDSIDVEFEASIWDSELGNKIQKSTKHSFWRGAGYGWPKLTKRQDLWNQDKDNPFEAAYVLNVKSTMKVSNNILPSKQVCIARTKIEMYYISFVWAIERFTTLLPTAMKTIRIKPPLTNGPWISLVIFVKDAVSSEVKIQIKITHHNKQMKCAACKISLLGAKGEPLMSFNDTIVENKLWEFPLFLTKEMLMTRRNIFLPDEHYPYCGQKICEPLSSPVFNIGESSWHFRLDSRLQTDGDHYFSLYLVREMDDRGQDIIEVDFEVMLLNSNPFQPRNKVQKAAIYSFRSGAGYGWSKFAKRKEILSRDNPFELGYVLIVNSTMKVSKSLLPFKSSCLGRTIIEINALAFKWIIEGFSEVLPNEMKTIRIKPASPDGPWMFLAFFVTDEVPSDVKIHIQVIQHNKPVKCSVCTISVIDANKKLWTSFNDTIIGNKLWEFSLSQTKDKLMTEKVMYLPNDELSLDFNCIVSAGIESEKMPLWQSGEIRST
ncbi:hypothetical protein HNY73_003966 [Argiope bruennichi]|uniref:MATH domain-containing protein n=1 Tax=Argiope bruennichi TaxID=94029 RepID=A0A8T0FP68_ARGBR|nr:hypothetical protein HNY73_003966 [Argiope bruennichi]